MRRRRRRRRDTEAGTGGAALEVLTEGTGSLVKWTRAHPGGIAGGSLGRIVREALRLGEVLGTVRRRMTGIVRSLWADATGEADVGCAPVQIGTDLKAL